MTLRTSALALVLLLSVSASVAGDDPCIDSVELSAQAPETFEAKFETSQGDFVIEVNRAWAPLAADRFYNLVKIGYYDNVRFFPVMPGHALQFGIHGCPSGLAGWSEQKIQDDPAKEGNKAGFVTFAKGAHNAPTTQVFINLGDSPRLDSQGFAPFGRVTQGMDVVAKINGEYIGPISNRQLFQKVPKLDYIEHASVAGDEPED